MKYSHIILSGAIVLASMSLASCIDNSDSSATYIPVSITNTLPSDMPADTEIVSGKVTFKELNTSTVTTVALPQYSQYLLAPGLYDIEATLTTRERDADGNTSTHSLRSQASSVVINDATTVPLEWYYFNPNNSLVLSEIYVTGSLNATGTGGIRDAYFRIYNNTDEIVYADGIGFAESALVNSKSNAFEILTEANDRQKAFTAGTVWVIPGSGTDYPILPGQSIKIADQAINWDSQVSGALDHTDADFEWYDDNPQDTDNPSVTNLDKWYCYSLSIWIASNQCNRSYALVRFPAGMTVDDYLAQYHGGYDYIHTTGSEMHNDKAYLIPNEWIIDGVNLSNKEVWVYGALGNAIDMSFASISDRDKDPERFGKKFVRKTSSVTPDGRVILKDTDDSLNDFEVVSAK